jgi:hypothetical protein
LEGKAEMTAFVRSMPGAGTILALELTKVLSLLHALPAGIFVETKMVWACDMSGFLDGLISQEAAAAPREMERTARKSK